MFLAEAVLYGLIASVVGYCLGIGLIKTFSATFPGILSANYSSGWVTFSVGTAMFMTIISTLYPMRVASKMVTPSLERIWRAPSKPKGDQWEILLPFSLTVESETRAICAFIQEYLEAHAMPRASRFSAHDIQLIEGEISGAPYVGLKLLAHLEPYDFGVQQEVEILVLREEEKMKWNVKMKLTRKKGSKKQWFMSNRRFVDDARKQLLLWNSLRPKDRERYFKESIAEKSGSS